MVATRARAILVLLFSILGLSQNALSRELFEGENAPTFWKGEAIYSADRIGGYQIYSGNGTWQFADARVTFSSGSASSIPMGEIRMTLWEGGELSATHVVTANLRSNNGAYWNGSPCDGESLAKRNRGGGRYDDCMTIKAQSLPVDAKPQTFLMVNTVESQTGGRYYAGTVGINVAYLGFPGSSALEWSNSAVQSDPAKASVLAKLVGWAEKYQDAVAAQMDYRRPADTFSSVPKLRELKVVPAVSATTQRPAVTSAKGASFVFCESSKTMVKEGSGACHAQVTPETE